MRKLGLSEGVNRMFGRMMKPNEIRIVESKQSLTNQKNKNLTSFGNFTEN